MQVSVEFSGYVIAKRADGNTEGTISAAKESVSLLERFLPQEGLPADVKQIGVSEIRQFFCWLQSRKKYDLGHPFHQVQKEVLSSYTINRHGRALRAFWNWMEMEGAVDQNSFDKVRIPKPSQKITPTFGQHIRWHLRWII